MDFAFAQGVALLYVMGVFVKLFGGTVFSLTCFVTIFSFLNLWLVIRITRRVLEANKVVCPERGIAAVLLVFLCSPYLWWLMAGIDSKSGYASCLLLAAVYLTYRAVNGAKKPYTLGVAGLLLGMLVASKVTFASVVPCFGVYVWYYSARHGWRALTTLSVSFVVGVSLFYLPVFNAVGLGRGVELAWDNFAFVREEYERRGTTMPQGFYNIGGVIRIWFLFVGGCLPFLLVYVSKKFQANRMVRVENSVLPLLFSCGLIYLVANVIALFPNVLFAHHGVIGLCLMLPILVWGYVVEAGDGPSGQFVLRGVVAIALFAGVPHTGLVLSERMTPLRPAAYVYEILGRNKMVETLDRLATEGVSSGTSATDYLYVGRATNSFLRSELRLSVFSAAGNAYMDVYDVDRETSNRLKIITMQNFSDVLQLHNVAMIAWKRFEQATVRTRRQLQEMRALLAEADFELVQADNRNELYIRQ